MSSRYGVSELRPADTVECRVLYITQNEGITVRFHFHGAHRQGVIKPSGITIPLNALHNKRKFEEVDQAMRHFKEGDGLVAKVVRVFPSEKQKTELTLIKVKDQYPEVLETLKTIEKFVKRRKIVVKKEEAAERNAIKQEELNGGAAADARGRLNANSQRHPKAEARSGPDLSRIKAKGGDGWKTDPVVKELPDCEVDLPDAPSDDRRDRLRAVAVKAEPDSAARDRSVSRSLDTGPSLDTRRSLDARGSLDAARPSAPRVEPARNSSSWQDDRTRAGTSRQPSLQPSLHSADQHSASVERSSTHNAPPAVSSPNSARHVSSAGPRLPDLFSIQSVVLRGAHVCDEGVRVRFTGEFEGMGAVVPHYQLSRKVEKYVKADTHAALPSRKLKVASEKVLAEVLANFAHQEDMPPFLSKVVYIDEDAAPDSRVQCSIKMVSQSGVKMGTDLDPHKKKWVAFMLNEQNQSGICTKMRKTLHQVQQDMVDSASGTSHSHQFDPNRQLGPGAVLTGLVTRAVAQHANSGVVSGFVHDQGAQMDHGVAAARGSQVTGSTGPSFDDIHKQAQHTLADVKAELGETGSTAALHPNLRNLIATSVQKYASVHKSVGDAARST